MILHSNTSKSSARRATLADVFRALLSRPNLRPSTSYITLPYADDKGKASPEIAQLVSERLLDEDQVIGINRSENIIKACRRAHHTARFEHGPWERCIHKVLRSGVKPGLIYLDTTARADGRVKAIVATLNLLASRMRAGKLQGPVPVVVNVILKRYGWKYEMKDWKLLKTVWPKVRPENVPFIFQPKYFYRYTQDEPGTHFIDKTIMGSYLFVVSPPKTRATLRRRAAKLFR